MTAPSETADDRLDRFEARLRAIVESHKAYEERIESVFRAEPTEVATEGSSPALHSN